MKIAIVPSAIAPALSALKLAADAAPYVCALIEAFRANDQIALKRAYVEMAIEAKRRAIHAAAQGNHD